MSTTVPGSARSGPRGAAADPPRRRPTWCHAARLGTRTLLCCLALAAAPSRPLPAAAQVAAPGAFGGNGGGPDRAASDLPPLTFVVGLRAPAAALTGPIAGGDPGPAATAPGPTGVTTADNVNLRAGPGTAYAAIAQLQRGTQRFVLGEQAGWYRVATAAGTVGWIAATFFQLVPPSAAAAGPVLANVIDDGVHLRTGPSTRAGSLGLLGADVQVAVLGREGRWYHVHSPGGHVGWVAAEYAALDQPVAALLPPTPAGMAGPDAPAPNRDVARLAAQFEGAAYRWGGAGLSGFDCSGFTQYLYRQVGVRLPRRAQQQDSRQYGQRLGPIRALLPGDLVFFTRTTPEAGITHIGIYVGAGRFITARTERLGVRYVSLAEPFWHSRYAGGLRPYR